MSVLLRAFPRNAATIAAVRRGCDGQRYPARCRERPCRRTRRCRGAWRPNPELGCVLPPCLEEAYIAAASLAADGSVAMTDVRFMVAEALGLPEADIAAERDTLEGAVHLSPEDFDPDDLDFGDEP